MFEWGQKPSDMGLCEPIDDLMLMWGYTRTKNLMKEYVRLEQEAEMKRKSKK